MGIQNLVEGFHGTDYSEDTIYRESIDELVLIREKKEFNIKVSRLMNVVINAFTNQNDQEWYQQLRTPIDWQQASGIRNRRLDGWLQELESKVKNFLGMISHKKSLMTIFGHTHKIKIFIKNFYIFH